MKFTLTTLLFAMLASSALAQRPEGRPEGGRRGEGGGEERQRQRGGGGPGDMLSRLPLYRVLDEDKDGKLSEKEIKNASVALMKLDKDGNGRLSAEEIAPNFRGRGGGGPRGEGARRGGGGDREGGRPERPRRPESEKEDSDDSES